MTVCRACGETIDAAAAACPSCGMPNHLRRQTVGWFGFAGRISVAEYWRQYAVPLVLIDLASGIIDAAASAGHVIDAVAAFATLAGSLAGATKRLHDRDRSGWFQLVVLIPVVGWSWVILEISCLPGTRGANRFGPDPLTAGPG